MLKQPVSIPMHTLRTKANKPTVINIFSVNNLHTFDGVSSAEIIAGDIFFEIVDPSELEYTYRIRPAKDFGAPFVCFFTSSCFVKSSSL